MTLAELQNKKIALLGFGREGQATFDFLVQHGIFPTAVHDLEVDINPDLASKLHKVKTVFISGPDYLSNLDGYNFFFRSPGLPRNHPALLALSQQDCIYSQTKLFFDLCPAPIVAVTGTKGKTTVSSLIYAILQEAGIRSHLCGNIGVPSLEVLDDIQSTDWAVIELSSFQTIDLHKSPKVGVILTVTADHMDDGTFRPSSHTSQEEYMQAKAQMIAHQSPDDSAILNKKLPDIFWQSGLGKKITYDAAEVSDFSRKLLGTHNLENIAAAVKACREAGIDEESARRAVANFSGVQNRLQMIGQKNGLTFINDSASTNPDATIAAVKSFEKNVILIVGGSDKGLSYEEFGKILVESPQVKGLVIIGQIAPQIFQSVGGFKGIIQTGAQNMVEIVAQAMSIAHEGDTVLLSPGAASFGMFKNYKDRGAQFDEVVDKL